MGVIQIKLIWILQKDKPSKLKMQFWRWFHLLRANLPDPTWKSNCPLNVISGCATLCSNNCNQMLAITGNESFTSLWRNVGPLFFEECFNSAALKGFRAWKDCLRSCHSISIGFKSGFSFGHSKTLILFFLRPFRCGLAGVLGIIVLLHNPSVLELEVTNWWPDILPKDFLMECRIHGSISYGSPRPSHYPHHVWLLVWCSFYEMLLVLFQI